MNRFLFISIEESFLIIFIAIIIFGPKKIPNIARELGEGIRYFKNAKEKIKNEIYHIQDNEQEKKIIKEKKIKKNTPTSSVKR
ncbi:Sec-independent protein translocase subunit TatA/TatB [Blattabacterium cuenoti]|uniref:Sec-independent protein translocase subunit TatA/TatB n=1 Tax=Blattabacterium cuenoti TaxID=1653831 RepID=UPI00163C16A9|nr:twin-arginine translocase TatA/TatE family subunit [Blattabacterium cuenoti]